MKGVEVAGRRTILARAIASALLLGALSVAAPATAQEAPAEVDLTVTISDDVERYAPGQRLTYWIQVFNKTHANVGGIQVVNDLPDGLIDAEWKVYTFSSGGCYGTGSGTGGVNGTYYLWASGWAKIKLTATVAPGTTGTLTNTVRVIAPDGSTNTNPADSASDVNEPAASADLRVTLNPERADYLPGSSITYNVTVTNNGPDAVSGARVVTSLPSALENISWTVQYINASGARSGSGGIDQRVNVSPGGSVTYKIIAQVRTSASGDLPSSVSVTAPTGVTDPATDNNTSRAVNSRRSDLPVSPGEQAAQQAAAGTSDSGSDGALAAEWFAAFASREDSETTGAVGSTGSDMPLPDATGTGRPSTASLITVTILALIVFGTVGFFAWLSDRIGGPAPQRRRPEEPPAA